MWEIGVERVSDCGADVDSASPNLPLNRFWVSCDWALPLCPAHMRGGGGSTSAQAVMLPEVLDPGGMLWG